MPFPAVVGVDVDVFEVVFAVVVFEVVFVANVDE